MTERDKIAARIRALLAKTVENGCTEDEAIAAAQKAAEMLARYNLTIDEVRMRETPFSRHTEYHEDWVGERLWKVAKAISHLTGSRYWTSDRYARRMEINFFGFEHEVEVSRYLLEICARAMRQEHTRLQRETRLITNVAVKRRRILPFLDGMAESLSRRIRELKPPEPTGKGLIVLRDQLIAKGLKDIGIKLKSQPMGGARDLDDAYRAGIRAGDKVALSHGLKGPQTHRERLLR